MIAAEFLENLPPDLVKKMEDGLLEYERKHGIDVNLKEFSIVLKQAQKVIGILSAFHSYNSIHIVDLWVEASHRGKGHGKKLIEALELHFKDKGFNNINTVTCNFQAPDFYRKCGFTEEFVRINKQNPELTLTFFVNFFEN